MHLGFMDKILYFILHLYLVLYFRDIYFLKDSTVKGLLWLGLQQGQASMFEMVHIQCDLTFLGLYNFPGHTTILCTVHMPM
jgi:hypothetical protein